MRAYHNEQRDWHIEEAAVQAVFNEYFGGGMNGIVFQEMREARSLAYDAAAYYSRAGRKGEKRGDFFTHIITQNDKMADCISHFQERSPTSCLTVRAPSASPRRVSPSSLPANESPKMGIISRWHAIQQLGLDYGLNQKICADLPKVTLQDIVNFERRRTWPTSPLRYLILGDEKELDIEALEKIGPIHRLTTEEVFGY